MSRELKFFDKEYYDDYRTMMESKGYHFFSVQLRGARFKLGGHRFK